MGRRIRGVVPQLPRCPAPVPTGGRDHPPETMSIKPTWAVLASSALAVLHSQGAIIARQDFEVNPAGPVLGYTVTTGTAELNTGIVTGGTPNTSTWGVDSSRGLSFTTNVSVVTFDAINTLDLTDVVLTMRLAALSLTSANGLDGSDTFVVSISTDNGATFTDQLRVTGLDNARWTFDEGLGNASRVYSAAAVSSFRPPAGGNRTTDGYTNLSISGLPSVEALVIRITATDDGASEKWLVDNVVVQAVPEPAAAMLGALGSLVLLRRRR